MRFNRVKKLWREGKPAIGGWLSIPHCFPAEVMAHAGFDWLCVDMQHGCIDYSDVVPMLTAISTTNCVPFVRVPWNEPSVIMKVLDAGAYGVIVPMVSNRAEAERAVAACRYPPVGKRSISMMTAGTGFLNLPAGEVVARIDPEIALFALVEEAVFAAGAPASADVHVYIGVAMLEIPGDGTSLAPEVHRNSGRIVIIEPVRRGRKERRIPAGLFG